MKTEDILSCGIDIGTTTTQLIISSLTLEVSEGFGKIPEISIGKREVIYYSDIFFTPLSGEEKIDAEGILKIISGEYVRAGTGPEKLKTGAVIITGESSKKENAQKVAEAVCSLSGDFAAAICGPDLEGILAGKGSGAAQISKEKGIRVMNLDIGGGTTNICVFEGGRVLDTACINIGGRLVRVSGGRISRIAPEIRHLTSLKEGDEADPERLKALAEKMARLIAQAAWLLPASDELESVKTNRLLSAPPSAELFIFSGGTSACMQEDQKDPFCYGDIGPLLARALRDEPAFKEAPVKVSEQARRSTVIGAGNYSLSLSGSTVEYSKGVLPLKNVPAVAVSLRTPEDMEKLFENIKKTVALLDGRFPAALYMEGFECPSFLQIQSLAKILARAADEFYPEGCPLIVIFRSDMAKALGKALGHILKDRRPFISIDKISCETGDLIDLGGPVAEGRVIPATVKTLVFGKKSKEKDYEA